MKQNYMKWPMLLILLFLLVGHHMANAQERELSGKVTSSFDSTPIPGVNILIKGSNRGTITDIEGNYQIAVEENDTLVFSSIGFVTEEIYVSSLTSNTFNLSMVEDIKALSEVVVVGYGTQKKSDITGAVASISNKRLESVPQVNLGQSLQGAVPGLVLNYTTSRADQNNNNIIIRGRNSITADNGPLIVLDGIPFSGNLSEINQNDVASIEVLKDASAAAIYGARGANGVILITTKKGKAGKTTISYDTYVGWEQAANIVKPMTGEEFYQFKMNRYGEEAFTPTELENYNNGVSTDWIDEALRTGVKQMHNIRIAGGDENTKYFISPVYQSVEGIAKNDKFEKVALRFNFSEQINDWLSFGTNTQLSQIDKSGVPANFEEAFRMNPLTKPYNEDGTLTIYPWPEDQYFRNPLGGINILQEDYTRRVITNNFIRVDVPWVEGLSYNLNTGFDFSAWKLAEFEGSNTPDGIESSGRSYLARTFGKDWLVENIIKYNRSFGKHSIDLTGLYSFQKKENDFHGETAEGLPGDFLTYYQNSVAQTLAASQSFSDESYLSQMFRANYSFDSRYLFTFTVRRDGYSAFGADKKFGVFPSIALGWNIANEPFFNADANGSVSNLKLRLSYGKNGNQAIQPYSTLSVMDEHLFLDPNGVKIFGYFPAEVATRNLGWETSKTFNAGVDFGFFKNRLRGTIDAYETRTTDLLLNKAINPSYGDNDILTNLGETKNTGVELQLIGTPIETDKLTWDVTLNLARNKNEIVDLYGDGQDDIANEWFIGHPIEVNYGYVFDGIYQETDDIENSPQPDVAPGYVKVKDLNGDNKITDEDRKILSSPTPKYHASLSNTVKYGRFTLNVFLYTVRGVTRANPYYNTDQEFIDARRNLKQLEYWSPENPINTYPANVPNVNPYGITFYEDASFIRLKDVTLAYDFSGGVIESLGISKFRIYATGQNLFTITDWTGLDPELSNQFDIPLVKSYILGLNISF